MMGWTCKLNSEMEWIFNFSGKFFGKYHLEVVNELRIREAVPPGSNMSPWRGISLSPGTPLPLIYLRQKDM